MIPRVPGTGLLVLGRTDFHTGIGMITGSALELFSRSMPVELYATRGDLGPEVILPSGRAVAVSQTVDGFAVRFYTDIIWNGVDDHTFRSVPADGFNIAHMAFDSDQLPPEWVTILNERFHVLACSSSYLEEVARRSGLRIPTITLPIALDLESLIARPYTAPVGSSVRFGTVSAFHERKGLELLVDAFLDEFDGDERVELVLHSNLAIGAVYDRIANRLEALGDPRVRISNEDLSAAAKDALIDSFDVYVNASAGEGYSIGPREALALGKPIVVTDVPAHDDFAGLPGVFTVPSVGLRPARYPEIDNRVFGRQRMYDRADLSRALRASSAFALSPHASSTALDRKRRAADFTMTTLESDYRRLVDPTVPGLRAGSRYTSIGGDVQAATTAVAGPRGARIGRRKLIVQSHDAGFFSLFNVFASHLAWAAQDSSPPMVLPDWDVGRLIERTGSDTLVSYCYSTPSDGNMWLSLFEPLYGLSAAELNDPEFLYRGGETPLAPYNEHKEPLLTYTNAFELYRAPWFARFRRQYNGVVREHVRLREHHRAELDGFLGRLDGRFVVAAHVKHPSHSVEQPNGAIAERHEYVQEVRDALAHRGIAEQSDDWRVFLATDQDRVVALFDEEFGDRVIRFDDVERIDVQTDAIFDGLDPAEQVRNGHQIQHILASDRARWSTRLAWEVWRDAEAMAASDVLIHAVSNVATAVSYLGPQVRMVFAAPDKPGF